MLSSKTEKDQNVKEMEIDIIERQVRKNRQGRKQGTWNLNIWKKLREIWL